MKTRYRRQPLAAATTLFLMALATPVVAENLWNPDAANSNWQDTANWSEGVPTSVSNDVWINSSANAPVIDGGPAAAAGTIYVGQEGDSNASLTIRNGGTVESTEASIGRFSGSTGTATINGPGSAWTNTNRFFVGNEGNGTLNISNGGAVESEGGTIGRLAGSTGVVTVEGPNSIWEDSFDLVVGDGGNGTLRILDGATVKSALITDIGDDVGSTGMVTVEGADSTMSIRYGLNIGGEGNGTLYVREGGFVASGEGSIGSFAGAKGEVIVTGESSLWANAGDLLVGEGGAGSLTIADKGHVDSDFAVSIGYVAGSQGSITVTGAGSALTSDSGMHIGTQGDGALTVEKGGGVVTEGSSRIGAETGSRGAVVITGAGSMWENSHTLTVGADGVGALTIADGGKVSNSGSVVGDGAGSQGAVIVTGTASTWESFESLSVGRGGVGTLVIEKGGEVSNRAFSVLGEESNSLGTVTLTGVGSKWTGGTFVAGGAGLGVLNVSDGGVFSSEDSAIGFVAGAEGKVTISGAGSAWTSTNTLSVGFGGTGTLDVRDRGAVNAAAALIGRESGSIGTATIDGTGSIWKIGSELLLGGDGDGTLTIRNAGTVDTASVSIAKEAGATGTLNIGAAEGEAAVAAGSLVTSNITFGAGTGVLNFNHTGNRDGSAVVFDTTISGAGAVNQLGSGTTVLTGANTYTGATTVSAGTLAVDGSIASSALTVQAGATLAGTGTVGTTVIAGTLSPGHSIGNLTVDGDLHQLNGSSYAVELGADGSSDHVHVTGSATIDSQVVLRLSGDGTYVPGTRYTVLTADGGVNGDYLFADTETLTAFLTATDTYDATHAYLDVSQSRSFASVAGTPNQIATANATERLGSGHVLFDKVLLLPSQASAQAAFDALSGEIHAGTRGALREQSSDLRNATAQRDSHKAGGFWTQGLGAWGHVRSDGNAARMETDRSGLLLGADWAIGEGGYVGVAGGYGKSSVKVDERRSSTDVDTLQAGVYGGLASGRFGLDAGIGYARHSLDGQRDVAFQGFSDHLKADYDAQTLQAYLRGTVQVNEAVSGFIEAASVDVKTDGFRERGGAAALTVHDDSTKATYGTVGVRLDLPTQSGPKLHGSLGWRQRFGGDDQTQATEQFAGGQPFTVLGAQTERKAFVGDVGLDWALGKNSQLSVSYAGTAGGGEADNRLDALFSMKF